MPRWAAVLNTIVVQPISVTMTWLPPDAGATPAPPAPSTPPAPPAAPPPTPYPLPGYGQPGYGQPGYGPLTYAPQPATKRGVAWWVVALVALLALVLGGVIGGVVVTVIGTTIGGGTPPVLTSGPGGELAAVSGEVGSCFRGQVDALFSSTELISVDEAVGCDRAHDVELYATTTAPLTAAANYPGEDLSYFADGACYVAFDEYVGISYEDSVYEYMPVVPSEAAWAAGDRAVRCVLYDLDGEALREPARGSQR